MIVDFEFGAMPLRFVLVFVLNIESRWRTVPNMNETAQVVFNNSIVQKRIFENFADPL
jgi:hypothetical protein